MQQFLEDIGELPAKYAVTMYDIYWETILDQMEPYPYVIPLMEYLRSHQIKIGVLFSDEMGKIVISYITP